MRAGTLAMGLALLGAAGLALWAGGKTAPDPSTPPAAVSALAPQGAAPPEAAVPQSIEQVRLSFAPVVKRAAPAVVNITTKTFVERRLRPSAGDEAFDALFGRIFGRDLIQKGEQSAVGSGVIVDPAGVVLTNAHVIKGADEIAVALTDRREFAAKVAFSDEQRDLAVLKIEAAGLPFLEFHDSDTLEPGDLVLAIGNPFGVGQTVTSGIVSAVMRTSETGQVFIQTDAAINPGNSGGALIDMSGKLVGVNTAILTESGGSQGVGFAIPANLARRAIESAATGSDRLARPWAGVQAEAVTAEIANRFGLEKPEGAIIAKIHPQSPLAKAGLKVGDVITAIDGLAVGDGPGLLYRLAAHPIGAAARIDYRRNGAAMKAQAERAAPPETPKPEASEVRGPNPLSGLVIANLSPAYAEREGFDSSESGVVVAQEGLGAGAQLGLRRGDILLSINGRDLGRVGDVAQFLEEPPRVWRIAVRRAGRTITFQARG